MQSPDIGVARIWKGRAGTRAISSTSPWRSTRGTPQAAATSGSTEPSPPRSDVNGVRAFTARCARDAVASDASSRRWTPLRVRARPVSGRPHHRQDDPVRSAVCSGVSGSMPPGWGSEAGAFTSTGITSRVPNRAGHPRRPRTAGFNSNHIAGYPPSTALPQGKAS